MFKKYYKHTRNNFPTNEKVVISSHGPFLRDEFNPIKGRLHTNHTVLSADNNDLKIGIVEIF